MQVLDFTDTEVQDKDHSDVASVSISAFLPYNSTNGTVLFSIRKNMMWRTWCNSCWESYNVHWPLGTDGILPILLLSKQSCLWQHFLHTVLQVSIPLWALVHLPVSVTLTTAMFTPKGWYYCVVQVLFENAMSIVKFWAVINGGLGMLQGLPSLLSWHKYGVYKLKCMWLKFEEKFYNSSLNKCVFFTFMFRSFITILQMSHIWSFTDKNQKALLPSTIDAFRTRCVCWALPLYSCLICRAGDQTIIRHRCFRPATCTWMGRHCEGRVREKTHDPSCDLHILSCVHSWDTPRDIYSCVSHLLHPLGPSNKLLHLSIGPRWVVGMKQFIYFSFASGCQVVHEWMLLGTRIMLIVCSTLSNFLSMEATLHAPFCALPVAFV